MQGYSGDKSGKKNNKCRCRCAPKGASKKNKKKQLYNAAGEGTAYVHYSLCFLKVLFICFYVIPDLWANTM